jgi:hypothetical protein
MQIKLTLRIYSNKSRHAEFNKQSRPSVSNNTRIVGSKTLCFVKLRL